MSLEFAVEAYSDAIEEMRLMYPAHWQEVGLDGPLDMNYEGYAEAAPRLFVTVARSNGELVGYHVVNVAYSARQRTVLTGITDICYLKRGFRKGFNGVNFLKFTTDALAAAGVERFFTTATSRNPFYKILERLGFTEVERVFVKRLKCHS